VLGRNFEDHLSNLRDALSRFGRHKLKLKPKKFIFFQQEVEFLGRKVSNDNIAMTEHDIAVVTDLPVPNSAKQEERFMGLVNYHRGLERTSLG
jgi:hypothetical protein